MWNCSCRTCNQKKKKTNAAVRNGYVAFYVTVTNEPMEMSCKIWSISEILKNVQIIKLKLNMGTVWNREILCEKCIM